MNRAKYISDVTYDYCLALKKGDAYLGRAVIRFDMARHPQNGEEGEILWGINCVDCMYLNLSVKALRSVKVNGEEVSMKGLYEQHRLKLWLVRECLNVGGTNTVEVEYY